MRVLVADDDDDIRYLVCTLLTRQGWDVTETASGEETLALLAGGARHDVLVLDQNMPPGSGLDVIVSVRAAGDPVPVVLFTGFVSRIDRDAIDEHGVTVLDKVSIKRLPEVLAGLTG